ncbi:hypothetical protein DSECCO2_238700 [anaerobic digester metagenome]
MLMKKVQLPLLKREKTVHIPLMKWMKILRIKIERMEILGIKIRRMKILYFQLLT